MLPKNAGDSGGGLLDAVAKVCAGVNPMEVGGGGKWPTRMVGGSCRG